SRRTLKYRRPTQVTSRTSASPALPASRAEGDERADTLNGPVVRTGMPDRPSLGQVRAALLHGEFAEPRTRYRCSFFELEGTASLALLQAPAMFQGRSPVM